MGITLNISWGEPADNSTASAEAAERSMQWAGGWFANPIWGPTGNYPQVMIDKVHFLSSIQLRQFLMDSSLFLPPIQIKEKSLAAGLPQSRLPVFTPEEIDSLKGSADFFGLNFYSSEYVREVIYPSSLIGYDTDKDTSSFQDKENWYG